MEKQTVAKQRRRQTSEGRSNQRDSLGRKGLIQPDQRPEAAAQASLQALANASPRVTQLQPFKSPTSRTSEANDLAFIPLAPKTQQGIIGGVEAKQPEENAPQTPRKASEKSIRLNQVTLSSLSELSQWYTYHALLLDAQQEEITKDGVAVPTLVITASSLGKQLAQECQSKGDSEISVGAALQASIWLDYNYVKAMNASEALKAQIAAQRLQALEQQQSVIKNQIDNEWLPQLRDKQRAAFRKSDHSELLSLADNIATVLGTSLIYKESILAIRNERAVLENMVREAKGHRSLYPPANSRVSRILGIAEKINKSYAAFQLVRTGRDLIESKKTASAGGRAALKAMSTFVSAGGTLLNASAGMTLYANLYLGPVVDACLLGLGRIEELRSIQDNRSYIAMGYFDMVNWSIEPGKPDGRPLFDFMLRVMRASDANGVPSPVPAKVSEYLIENEDLFNAGIGGKDNMPTEGAWRWKVVDSKMIAHWLFRHRQNLWAMLYGDVDVI